MTRDFFYEEKIIQYSGYCKYCKCEHGIESEVAIAHANKLMQLLSLYEHMELEGPETNPKFSTDNLYEFSGQMLGVLLGVKPDGTEIVLKAFSGTHYGYWLIPGWCPPLLDTAVYEENLKWGNDLVHPLTAQILATKNSELKKELEEKRKVISQETRKRYLDSYQLHLRSQKTISLYEALGRNTGIPMGMGDCAAPKLLNEANRLGIKPLSLVEFYWGKDSKDGLRTEGQIYPSCAERCSHILGTLLCPHA